MTGPDSRDPGRPSRKQLLSGWGRHPAAETELFRPETISSLERAVAEPRHLIARGCGRSYGDASFLGSGATVDLTRMNRLLDFDPDSGTLHAEAGVTLEEMLAIFMPRGYFPPVTPGTRFVTLGGCVACDVHGKNHHKSGSFSSHVLGLELLTASGARLSVSPESDPDIFWATVGGMGLTGVITSVTIRLTPVETSFLHVDYDRAGDLGETMSLLAEGDRDYTYSVAWIDCLARGSRMGRSVLMRGGHAPHSSLPNRLRSAPLSPGRTRRLAVPFDVPASVLNRPALRLFNELYFRSHPRSARDRLVHFSRYFYPLDGIAHWNRLYGRRGLVQYQCVLPEEGAHEGLKRVLTTVSDHGAAAFLAVLKRFGSGVGDVPSLSFPMRGYTLSLDLPRRSSGLAELVDSLDRTVETFGGRIYLAKDACLSAHRFRRMYPSATSWMEIKARVDPDGRFRSDLAGRLGLLP